MSQRRSTRSRRAGVRLISGIAALAAAAVIPAAHAAGASPAASAPGAASSSPGSTAPTVRVVLPTGDTVSVGRTSDGRPSYGVLAADRSGISGTFSNVDLSGQHYVLPGEVKPLLGNLVDPSLFDVTALAGSRTPSTVTATVTSRSAAVPGLTVTRRTPTTLTGHVDAAGAAAFRSALVRAATSVASGQPQNAFPGVTRLSGAGSAGVVSPDYPQVALTLSFTGKAGQPAPSGFVILTNTDDARRYNGFVFVDHGKARVSVPLGHYSALGNVSSFAHRTFASLDVPIADYTVTDEGQTLSFDTTTATVEASLDAPSSPQVVDTSVTWNRTDATRHGSTSFSDDASNGATVRWAPTPAPVYGTQSWETYFHADGRNDKAPSTYDLSYAAQGAVPSTGRHVVAQSDLASVDASFYEDRRTESAFGRGPLYPGDFFIFFNLYPLRTPARVTQYVGGDGAQWVESLIGNLRVPHNFFGGDLVDQADPVTYRAGSHRQVDWLRGPLAPGPFEDSVGARFSCTSCRTATSMQIALAPFTDTVPGHIGEGIDLGGGTPALVTNLSADGRRLAGGRDRTFLEVPVSPSPRHYRLLVKGDRSGDGTTLSTSSLTTYGFTSGATTGGEPVSADSSCQLAENPSACRTLGLLRVTAPLPTDLYRTLPVGRSSFRMTIAPYGGSTQQITTASVGVRVSDSAAFTPATVTRVGPQQFRVTLDNPADWAGQPVTFRVIAADAAGDTINQTTTAAYAVAAAH